jgi:hypothetical protein
MLKIFWGGKSRGWPRLKSPWNPTAAREQTRPATVPGLSRTKRHRIPQTRFLRTLIVSIGCLQQNFREQIQQVGFTVSAAHIRGVDSSNLSTATKFLIKFFSLKIKTSHAVDLLFHLRPQVKIDEAA